MTERVLESADCSPKKLAHFVLLTGQLEKMVAWYKDVLRAKPAFENEQLCFLAYDDEHHRVGLISVPRPQERSDVASNLGHIAFTYETLGDLLGTYLRLKTTGISPFWTINHGPTISFYYRDPDGNKIELQYDVFPTVEAVDAFFAGGAYEENFIGVIFDPDEFVARYREGIPESKLTERPRLPAGMSPWDMIRD